MDHLHQILKQYWGFTEFRPLQLDIIHSVMHHNDTLALMPTGGGKSLCFQVPALAQKGICIVVSPLIALMNDQVEKLSQKGIKAVAITSAMNKREVDIALDNCVYGDFKFLYLSPERLNSDIAQVRIKKMEVNLIAIDEAHCISQWGYDFRPSYLKVAELRTLKPDVPVLALTATATPGVIKDIQQKLEFKKPNVLQKSFARSNLAYVVLHEEDKNSRLIKICNNVKGSAIIYARSRKKTQEITELLNRNNILADFYHAGLATPLRSKKQSDWINSNQRVIVCTNAFGMGIDKPDVRLVIHYDLPDCIESYFQEAGRAGRDEHKAYAILLYNDADIIELERRVISGFPDIKEIRQIYQAIANYYQLATGSGEGKTFDFDIAQLCNRYNLNAVTVYNALKLLEKEEYLTTTESLYQPSRLHFTVHKDELYKFQVANKGYDSFIKLLLRSYTGLFENYVKFNENDLVIKSGLGYEQVVQFLNYLGKVGLLSYLPQTEMPQLTFNLPRVDSNSINISKEHLKIRKEKALERMRAIAGYATNPDKCRSQLLLAYFGETNTDRCGICDYCLERNKSEVNSQEFDDVSGEIKSLLFSNHLSLKELVTAVTGAKENKTLKVIQWLLDNGRLYYDKNNRLQWKD
ncbi:MAG: RecQ family ATP-dependent DNA helicase [Bacteroidetes bacterium]|nr:RecQ family ATP-dependent DNA helicase [Bacteroidota bacterium]